MESNLSLIDSILNKYANKDDETVRESLPVDTTMDESNLHVYDHPMEYLPEEIDLTQSDEEENIVDEKKMIPILDKKVKIDKQMEKLTKQSLKDKEKYFKDALTRINNNKKPDNCLKLVSVILDNNLQKECFTNEILQQLSILEIQYEFAEQVVPASVTWKCVTESLDTTAASDKPLVIQKIEESEQLLLLIQWNNLVELVNEQKLKSHISNLKEVSNKSIFLCIFGMESYFKYQRNPIKKYERIYGKHPKITQSLLEHALTELQLFCSCSYRLVEQENDLALLVVQFTKSIAQIPYKLEQIKKNTEFDWHLSTDNKDCVQVDKDGNGLKRLWRQQLTLFSGATLETADAIASLYETPADLINKLENSTQYNQGFLKDVPIRRNSGRINSNRKIGNEISKRVHSFFTSTDGNEIL